MENINLTSNQFIIIVAVLIVVLIAILVLTITVLVNNGKKKDESRYLLSVIKDLEKNVIKDSHDSFIKIMNQNQNNSDTFNRNVQTSIDKLNDTNEKKLNEIRTANEQKLNLSPVV